MFDDVRVEFLKYTHEDVQNYVENWPNIIGMRAGIYVTQYSLTATI